MLWTLFGSGALGCELAARVAEGFSAEVVFGVLVTG